MKSILNLFRPSAREEQLEAELSGKPSATSATSVQPPKRGTAASPASLTPGGADVSELMTLRSSLQAIESKLQATASERDSLKAEFQDYRQAANSEQRSLEDENRKLRQSLDETGRMLSKQIASSGLDAPIAEGGAEVVRSGGDEIRGLARSIAAAKAEAAATKFERIPRPTL